MDGLIPFLEHHWLAISLIIGSTAAIWYVMSHREKLFMS